MRYYLGLFFATLLPATAPVNADEYQLDSRSIDWSSLNWFAGVDVSYLNAGGDINFAGTTNSVYGGTPTISMDDGGRLALRFGFETRGAWRIEGDLGYVKTYSDTRPFIGFDDRSDDLFSVDAEIESLTFMLNGSYDFDIGSSRFTPFLQGGVGVSRNRTTSTSLDVEFNSAIWDGTQFEGLSLTGYEYPEGSSTEFAWSFSAGLRAHLSRHFSATLEYGLLSLGDALTETDANGDALGVSDLMLEQLTLGLDYRF